MDADDRWEPDLGHGASGNAPGVRSGSTGSAPVADEDDALVRPFVITGGRTRHARVHLRVESLVVATGLEVPDGLQFEHARIVALCDRPVSVAEIAARVELPLGVAQVLVGDLADAGLVRVHEATTDATPALLLRMIDAVRAL
jgi:hypothetical protein